MPKGTVSNFLDGILKKLFNSLAVALELHNTNSAL